MNITKYMYLFPFLTWTSILSFSLFFKQSSLSNLFSRFDFLLRVWKPLTLTPDSIAFSTFSSFVCGNHL